MSDTKSDEEKHKWFGRAFIKVQETLEQRARREEEMERNFNQQLVLASGTVGAMAFAGLVFIVQDSSLFGKDFGTLVAFLGLTSVMEMLSLIASMFGGAGVTKFTSPLGVFGYVSAMGGFGLFMVSVVFAVDDADPSVGDWFIPVVLILLVAFVVFVWKTTFGEKRLEDELNDAVFSVEAHSDTNP